MYLLRIRKEDVIFKETIIEGNAVYNKNWFDTKEVSLDNVKELKFLLKGIGYGFSGYYAIVDCKEGDVESACFQLEGSLDTWLKVKGYLYAVDIYAIYLKNTNNAKLDFDSMWEIFCGCILKNNHVLADRVLDEDIFENLDTKYTPFLMDFILALLKRYCERCFYLPETLSVLHKVYNLIDKDGTFANKLLEKVQILVSNEIQRHNPNYKLILNEFKLEEEHLKMVENTQVLYGFK